MKIQIGKFLNKRLKELGIQQVLEYLVILISHTLSKLKNLMISNLLVTVMNLMLGEFKHEVRQFQKPYDNQQAEQISLMV